jgi:hypothetical protein
MSWRVVVLLGGIWAVAAVAQPVAEVASVDAVAATPITLSAKERPASEVFETIARAMGFSGVVFKNPASAAKAVTCEFAATPAWQALVELFAAHGLTFGSNEIGQDYLLSMYDVGTVRYSYSIQPGLVARFWQAAPGTVPSRRQAPCAVWIRPEPRLGWSCSQISVPRQLDGAGAAREAIGFDLFGGQPQMKLLPGANPWPGLAKLTLTAEVDRIQRWQRATVSRWGAGPFDVTSEGKLLFSLSSRNEGRFVDVLLTMPSALQASFVAQGGWGNPVEEQLAQSTAIYLEVYNPDGSRMAPGVISGEGDGKQLQAKVRLLAHRVTQAGGLEQLKFVVSVPLARQRETLQFVFDDLPR